MARSMSSSRWLVGSSSSSRRGRRISARAHQGALALAARELPVGSLRDPLQTGVRERPGEALAARSAALAGTPTRPSVTNSRTVVGRIGLGAQRCGTKPIAARSRNAAASVSCPPTGRQTAEDGAQERGLTGAVGAQEEPELACPAPSGRRRAVPSCRRSRSDQTGWPPQARHRRPRWSVPGSRLRSAASRHPA